MIDATSWDNLLGGDVPLFVDMLGELIAILGIYLLVLLPIYFLPTFIAYGVSHTSRFPIFLLNFFLGSSVIGWVAAFAWALMSSQHENSTYRQAAAASAPNPFDDPPRAPTPQPDVMTYLCPHCRRPVGLTANLAGYIITCVGCGGQFIAPQL